MCSQRSSNHERSGEKCCVRSSLFDGDGFFDVLAVPKVDAHVSLIRENVDEEIRLYETDRAEDGDADGTSSAHFDLGLSSCVVVM